MKVFALGLITLLISTSLLQAGENVTSKEPCDCDRYADMIKFSNLAHEVSTIGLGAAISNGRAFEVNSDTARILRLRFMAQAGVPEYCRKKLLSADDYTALALVRFALAQPPLPSSKIIPDSGMNYLVADLSRTLMMRCGGGSGMGGFPAGSAPNGTEAPAGGGYGGNSGGYGAFVPPPVDCNLPPADRLRAYAATEEGRMFLGIASPAQGNIDPALDNAKLVPIYLDFLAQKSDKGALGFLASRKGEMSTSEKLMLVQSFGDIAVVGYDMKRFKAGISAKGGVSLSEILAAAKINTTLIAGRINEKFAAETGYPSPIEDRERTFERIAVCRDIASGQAQALDALGFRDTYALSYSIANASHHVTVITRDPDHPIVYKYNYGDLDSSQSLRSEAALYQGWGDGTLNYRIFKPGGGLVADTPSAFGKFLAEAAGFDVKSLDPLAQQYGNLGAAQVRLGESERYARIFYGSDGVGQTYFGAALTQQIVRGKYFAAKAGLTVGTQHKAAGIGRTLKDVDNNFVYFQVEESLRSPSLSTKNGVAEIHAESKATTIIAVNRVNEPEVDPAIQGDIRSNFGVRATYGMSEDAPKRSPVQAQVYAGVQLVPGIADIRNAEGLQQLRPALNYVTVAGEVRALLNRKGDAYAGLLATLVCSQIGCRGAAEAQAAYSDFAASLALEGALSKDMAPYEEGVEQRVRARLLWRIFGDPKLMLEVTGHKSLQTDEVGVNGSLIYRQ